MIPVTELPKTIILKGDFEHYEEGRISAGTPLPGMLVQVAADLTIVVHPTAAGPSEKTVLIEDALQGSTIDTPYNTTDKSLARYCVLEDGEEFYGLLKAGENVTPADFVMSAGDGTFAKLTGAGAVPLAKPRESVNNTGGSAVRIKLRML